MKSSLVGSNAAAWVRRSRSLLFVALLTILFLFAPAMQGTGFTAGTQSQVREPAEVALDRAARAAVADLAERP